MRKVACKNLTRDPFENKVARVRIPFALFEELVPLFFLFQKAELASSIGATLLHSLLWIGGWHYLESLPSYS